MNFVLQLLDLEESIQRLFAVPCWFFSQIKALISAPSTEVVPTEVKKPAEEASPTAAPAAEDPTVASRPNSVDRTNVAQAMVLLGKRNVDKLVFLSACVSGLCLHFQFNV